MAAMMCDCDKMQQKQYLMTITEWKICYKYKGKWCCTGWCNITFTV